MKNKAVLLRSVSALATAAASTAGGIQQANAQVLQPGAEGYYYSVQGGLGMTSSETFLANVEDKYGSGGSGLDWYSSYSSTFTSGFDDLTGINGSVSFGKQLDENFDIRGTLSATHGGSTSGFHSSYYEFSGSSFQDNFPFGSSFSYESGYVNSEQEGAYNFGFAAADLEIGYTPVLSEDFSVRLFAGIRALAFRATFEGWDSGYAAYNSSYYSGSAFSSAFYSSYYSSYNSWYYSGLTSVEFAGIGPRLGAQGAMRFEGTDFGLSGSLATSVLFGKKTTSFSGYHSWYSSWSSGYDTNGSGSGSDSDSDSGAGYSSFSDEVDATVLNVQASIGLDYYLNDNTALTVGVQAEKLFELDADNDFDAIDVTTTGVFAKLSGTF